MATEEMVNELLNEIKSKLKQIDSKLDAEKVFLNGNCGNMYTIFANYFPKKAVVPHIISYNKIPYHIISEIDGEFYDITGKTSFEKYIDYVQKNNPNSSFLSEKFSMERVEIADRSYRVNQMSDMYDYDENYEQSGIANQMYRLEEHLKLFKESKSKEEK